jgi:hypothetical protein
MVSRSATTRLAPVALLLLCAALTVLALPQKAGAASMLPNPLTIDDSSYTGGSTEIQIAYVGTDSGEVAGGTYLVGTSGDLVLIFQVTVITGSIDYLEMTVDTPTYPNSLPFYYQTVGIGTINLSGSNGTATNVTSGSGTAATPRFNFGTPLTAGETSSKFYLYYDSAHVGGGLYANGAPLANGTETITFKADAVDAYGGAFGGTATLIPEPGSLLLLGLGLGFLGRRASGRKKA